MSVYIFEGQDLQMRKSIIAHIPDHTEGDPVVDGVHQPLGNRGSYHNPSDLLQNLRDAPEVYPALSTCQINRTACQNREVQHEDCGEGSQKKR